MSRKVVIPPEILDLKVGLTESRDLVGEILSNNDSLFKLAEARLRSQTQTHLDESLVFDMDVSDSQDLSEEERKMGVSFSQLQEYHRKLSKFLTDMSSGLLWIEDVEINGQKDFETLDSIIPFNDLLRAYQSLYQEAADFVNSIVRNLSLANSFLRSQEEDIAHSTEDKMSGVEARASRGDHHVEQAVASFSPQEREAKPLRTSPSLAGVGARDNFDDGMGEEEWTFDPNMDSDSETPNTPPSSNASSAQASPAKPGKSKPIDIPGKR